MAIISVATVCLKCQVLGASLVFCFSFWFGGACWLGFGVSFSGAQSPTALVFTGSFQFAEAQKATGPIAQQNKGFLGA
eukprot:5712716-Amphidinium_carterae.1